MDRVNKNVGCLMLAAVLGAASVPAQEDFGARRAKVDTAVSKALVAFGRRCESFKMPSRARRLYRTVLDHYDDEQPTARRGLGFKRVKGEWQQVTADDKLPRDQAKPSQRRSLDRAWKKTCAKVAQLHRDFGVELLDGGHVARAHYQFERVLAFLPADVEAHKGLGHEEHDGFWGTEGQIAFVTRMRALNAKANELAQADFDVEMLDASQMPRELQPTGLAFVGARSRACECWLVGEPAEAANYVLWAERALRMLEFICGEDLDARKVIFRDRMKWVAVIRNEAQRDQLLSACPAALGGESIDRVRLYGGATFKVGSKAAEWTWNYKETDADGAIGHVTQRYFSGYLNSGFSEGIVHAMTWWLHGTLDASYMKLPHTVTSGGDDDWKRDAELWQERLQDQIDAGEDWPLVQVPRERMDNFRDPCRAKSWSFMRWLIARYPAEWHASSAKLRKQRLSTGDVGVAFEQELDRAIGDVEYEWREWARRGSAIGEATRR